MSVQATITCVIFVITILLLVFKPIPIIITGAIIPTALALLGLLRQIQPLLISPIPHPFS